MAKDVFSIPIFFIVFREALEAVIVISVLLALVEQIAHEPNSQTTTTSLPPTDERHEKATHHSGSPKEGSVVHDGTPHLSSGAAAADETKALIRKMRIQVFAGAGLGFFIALAIGAAFLAVWFTRVTDLFGANEELWEASFNLIAAILIFVMALTMLRIDKAKAKWRVKLHAAFLAHSATPASSTSRFKFFSRSNASSVNEPAPDAVATGSKWALFLLPFITVLREGLEAVVFIGGVSLGQKATAIPLAAIVGLFCGLLVGYLIYISSSRTSLTIFLVLSTNLLLLVGAGLFSKAVGGFERDKFNKMVGADVAEAGNGPGSYDVRGNIWHLDCCNPENKFDSEGWAVFAGIFGWSNNGSLGTVLAYIFYWIAAIVALLVMNFTENKRRRSTAV